MIVVDANILVALTDRRDAHHARCAKWVTTVRETLVGVGYPYQLVDLVDADVRRMAELVRQYADRRLGGTDASVIALAERLKVTTVATVNTRDFANVRPRHVDALHLVPN